jgi:16S rRNA (guanine527-N7)-methyltransferase
VDSWITPLTRPAAARNVRHPHRTHPALRLARGTGKPGREPDEQRQDGAEARCDERRRRERSPDGPQRHDRQEGCLDRPRDPLPTRVADSPPLPAAFADALDAGLASLHLALTAEARVAIEGHVRLLLAWNAAINLTAIREPAEIAVRHVLDSLAGASIVERVAGSEARIVDLGSGGGFPGLPLAAALPRAQARLIESVAKKARFLETAVKATGLASRVEVLALRAESLAVDRARTAGWDVVTARAVASLADLVELAFPLLRPGGSLIAWKAASALEGAEAGLHDARSEIAAARRAMAAIDPAATLTVELAVPTPAPAVVAALASHRLVVVRRGSDPIRGSWPRDPAGRRRKPW